VGGFLAYDRGGLAVLVERADALAAGEGWS
jgi:hypothetical protein